MTRAVIFDCDGVLVDSEAISNRVLAGLFTDIGMPMTPEQSIEAFMGRSWKNVVAWADERGGLPDGFRRRYLDGMFAAFEAELRPVPGIVGALCSTADGMSWAFSGADLVPDLSSARIRCQRLRSQDADDPRCSLLGNRYCGVKPSPAHNLKPPHESEPSPIAEA